MYVLFISLFFILPSNEAQYANATRNKVESYINKEACQSDIDNQVSKFVSKMPREPDLIGTYCVEVTGPAGNNT
jgi:flagellar biosynthesis protein FliP